MVGPMTLKMLRRLLCLLGFHDFELVEVITGFGPAGNIAKLKCKRCHLIKTRSS